MSLISATPYANPSLQWDGQSISFSAIDESPGIELYLWNLGDTVEKTVSAFDYIYASDGSRNVTLKVTSGTSSSTASTSVRINRLPSISFSADTLSAGEPITFTDDSAIAPTSYFDETVVSADWSFGDGSTSSVTDSSALSASLIHTYTSLGSYDVSISAYDLSGNVGVGTTNVPLFSTLGANCLLKDEYISLCGPKELARFGANRDINLVENLPLYLRGGETEDFTQLFEDFLNEMFDGLGGFETSSTDLSISTGYEDGADGQGGVSGVQSASSDDNWPRENTYYTSSTSANNETDASLVKSIKISNPANIVDQKISILEKVNRITELHDPDLIDIEYIQFFAKNLGYDIDINRNEVGISAAGSLGSFDFGDDSPCISADNDRYLRFTIRNLPTWYKIKSTDNAIKVMLYSFGLVGELIEYFTDNYLPTNDGGKWRLDYTGEFTNISDGWYPTPHFAISINIDESADITNDVKRRSQVIRAIESVRPINTVFRNLSAYLLRYFTIEVGSIMRMRRYIKIESDGWANNWADENGDEGTPPDSWTPKPL